ncbi:MAG: TRAP transporter small permease [Chitinophagales bacterium]
MHKVSELLYRTAMWISAITVGLATLVVVLQVIVRYCFSFSFSWGDEVSRFFMIWTCFIGVSCVVYRAELANMEFLLKYLPFRYRALVQLIAQLISIFFLGLIVWYGAKQVLSPALLGQASPALRLPMWIPYISVPIGALISFWFVLETIIKQIKNWRENYI